MNWLDLVIIVVLLIFAYFGYRNGFLLGIIELIGIAVSLVVPFLLYIPVGHLLESFGVSRVYAGALAFFIIWFIIVSLYFGIMRRLYKRVPKDVHHSNANRVFGIIPGTIRGLIIVAMFLTLAAVLPNRFISQSTLEGSTFVKPMLDTTMRVSVRATDIFGRAVHEALGFLTIRPESDERIELKFRVSNPVPDAPAEEKMLMLVNQERTKRGLKALIMDNTIRNVARTHSADMLRNGYFSHTSLDGSTPFERMRRGGVRYLAAGENITYAPTVDIAHAGLMKSPGHRANILNPAFGRIGIGVERGSVYQTMFTQNFAN
ncbi:MAG: CvpA family protein [Armatimonadota bacterium]